MSPLRARLMVRHRNALRAPDGEGADGDGSQGGRNGGGALINRLFTHRRSRVARRGGGWWWWWWAVWHLPDVRVDHGTGKKRGGQAGMRMHVAAVPPMARPQGHSSSSTISFKKLFDSALLRQSLVKDLFTSRVGILIIPRLPPPLSIFEPFHAEYISHST